MRCKCTPSAPARYPCRSREILRYTTQRAIPRTIGKQEGVRAEARTVELRAVAQLARAAARSPAPPCRRAPTHPPPPHHPARRRMAQQAPPSPLGDASGRPTSRCGAAPARALASARYRRARRGHKRRLNPSSEPAGGSLLPPPPPPAQGAAAHHRWFTGYQSFPPVSFMRGLPAATQGDSSQYGRI